ncbi:MAG: CDP-glycerol glycerophosphotransferase family protein [Clostridia bacterium]|nr:CDP-glycerol glycerophosphotransferase family protein [Clostridia bacterium]
MEIYLGLSRVKNSKLHINGYAENVADAALLVFKIGGKEIFANVKKSAVKTNRYNFEIVLAASDNEVEFPAEISFQKYSTLSNDRKAVLSSGYKLSFKGNRIFVKKASISDKISVRFSLSFHYLKTHQKVFLNRLSVRETKERIWLYCDRENLIDNGYYQFIHDLKKNDGIKRYYLTSQDIKEKYFPSENENVILFKSAEHKKIFFACEKIISAFNSMSIYSPFGSDPTAFYYDLINYDVIYLQHGVLHANLPDMYAKENALVDKIVISSEFEQKNFQENYGYNAEDLIDCGMPRYDFSDKNVKAKRKILFSPSWRGNLIGAYKNNKRELMTQEFLQSAFYKETQAFLSSPELHRLLEEYDLVLDFKNHPIFAGYNDLFDVKSDRVTVSSGDMVTDDYLVMITDYSSVVFDFVYLKRPIIYFVPDYEDFRNGISHGYNKLDLPLEEGFGKLTFDSENLLSELCEIIKREFIPEKVFSDRMDNFFIHDDKNQRARFYQYMMNE